MTSYNRTTSDGISFVDFSFKASRHTHDRLNDHFGFDKDSNVVIDGAVGSTPTGTDLHTTLTDLNAAIVAGGGGGPEDLLTGDDAIFATGIGNWTATAGSFTYDTTNKFMILAGSAKWASPTNTTDYVSVPVSGTFTSGTEYHAAICLAIEETINLAHFNLSFGLFGTDATTDDAASRANGVITDLGWTIILIRWVPSADRTGVTLRVARGGATGTQTIHIGYARVVKPNNTTGLAMISDSRLNSPARPYPSLFIPMQRNGTTDITAGFGAGIAKPPTLRLAGFASMLLGGGIQNDASVAAGSSGALYLSGGGTAGSDLSGEGVEIQLAPDYIGLYISEKDSSTIQIYDDSSGAFNIELVDQGSYGFKTVGAFGSYKLQDVAAGSTAINMIIDGGTNVIATGIKGELELPFDGVITANRLFADASGSIVIDLWKDTYANYPPTVADTITASAKPTLSSSIKSEDTTLTGWSTTFVAGETLRVNVDSASTVKRVTLSLTVRRA